MSSTFVEAQHAAELAVAAMAVRALLQREASETDEVRRLVVTAELHQGLIVVDATYEGQGGIALGGLSL